MGDDGEFCRNSRFGFGLSSHEVGGAAEWCRKVETLGGLAGTARKSGPVGKGELRPYFF